MKHTKDNSPLQAIRQNCYDCGDGTPKLIRECHITDCPFYIFRFGTNPKRKREAQSKNQKSINYISNNLIKKGTKNDTR